jgi:hypothetical protein
MFRPYYPSAFAAKRSRILSAGLLADRRKLLDGANAEDAGGAIAN